MWDREFISGSSSSDRSKSPQDQFRYFSPVRPVSDFQRETWESPNEYELNHMTPVAGPERSRMLELQRKKLNSRGRTPSKVTINDFSPNLPLKREKIKPICITDDLDEEILEVNPSRLECASDEEVPLKPMEDSPLESLEDSDEDSDEEEEESKVTPPTKEIILGCMANRREFLTSPVPKGITLQCTIRRDRSGFSRFHPKYYMYISDGLEFIAAAKKRPANRTSNYLITMNQHDFSKKSSTYIAKVRSNFVGSQFSIYSNGLNPKDKKATLS